MDPAKIFVSAIEGDDIERKYGKAALQSWQLIHPDWCNENDPSKPVVDLVQRCAKLGRMPAAQAFIHRMPWTGRGTLREIHKLVGDNDDKLRTLFERDMIKPTSKRKDIDNLRTAQKVLAGGEVAPRHRGQRT